MKVELSLDIQVVIRGRQLFTFVCSGEGSSKTEMEERAHSKYNDSLLKPKGRDSLSGLYTYKMLPWNATPQLEFKKSRPQL